MSAPPAGPGWPAARVVEIVAEPLSVALREPFVIASGRMDATRAALVIATVADAAGRRATGLGEAAALPPVTHEDQPDLLRALAAARPALLGLTLERPDALDDELRAIFPDSAVARAGVAAALVDAWARLCGVPLRRLLAGPAGAEANSAAPPTTLTTDITLPIAEPAHMATLAVGYHAAGFRVFKVKIGRDFRADHLALRAVAAAVPGARFILDANGGFTARDALTLLDLLAADRLTLECFEQPCARDDWRGMAEVTARSPVTVVADESFRGGEDLERVLGERAAHGVNLKLAKLGGPAPALLLGRRARAHGLKLMAGAMVETRVGIATMAEVVAALGGVEWVDLDTAFLLATDPFSGGYTEQGPRLTLGDAPGTGVQRR
jgi:L-alanine-DL-glutamate epimerase-like enolase superfamily enzyme